MTQKLSTSTWAAVLGVLAGVAIMVGVVAKGGGATEAQIPDQAANPISTQVAEPMSQSSDPVAVATTDTGMTVNDPALKPVCMGVPAQGVGMMYGGQRYTLLGSRCEDASKVTGATQVGETTASDFGSAAQQVYQMPDGSIYTLDAASGTWSAWGPAGY